jgi:hypothetical protein
MSPKMMLVAISIYQYLMLILTSIFLLIIPVIKPHQFFNSLFVDILARCVLWVCFTIDYLLITYIIKSRIKKRNIFFLEMQKDIISFFSLSVWATVMGIFCYSSQNGH